MAFDLTAILRLDDRMSNPLRQIERQIQQSNRAIQQLNRSNQSGSRFTDLFSRSIQNANRQSGYFRDSQGRLRDSMGRYASEANLATHATNQYSRSLSRISGSSGSAINGFNGLRNAILGIASAYAAVNSAQSIFQNTVGEAMKYEMSAVTIDAMFNSKELGKQYRDMVEDISIESPILESQEMLMSSRGFITKSTDFKDLERMIKLTEKLAAYDPIQGTKGGAFALNEFMSGDTVSLVERFELSRSDLKPIKDLFMDGQISKGLEEFDKYLESIGISTKLIKDMGETTIGKVAQVKEQFARVFRLMGEPSLVVVSDFLSGVLTKLENGELDRFKEVGAKWIKNIITGLTNGVMDIYNWFNGITSSDKWKESTTLSSKIDIIIDDLSKRFTKWYESEGGREDLESMAKTLTTGLSTFLEDNAPTIASAALKVGSSIGKSLKDGMIASFKENNPILYNIAKLVEDPNLYLFGGLDKPKSQGGKYQNPVWYQQITGDDGKSHNGGLNYVPYDGYKAVLHKGERVLTRGEATESRQGSKGNTYNFDISMNGTGYAEQDAEKLFQLFVQKIETAGGAGA